MQAKVEINGGSVTIQLTPEQIEQLKQQVKAPQTRWRAEKGEKYYCVSNSGELIVSPEDMITIDNFRYASGNYFKTKEEAEKHLNYTITRQKVKDRITELNDGWVPDWSDEFQSKYRFEYWLGILRAGNFYPKMTCENWKYVPSGEVVEQLMKDFTEQELILALFEIHE